jgi:tetratricopeptide (TPR) repeat protein
MRGDSKRGRFENASAVDQRRCPERHAAVEKLHSERDLAAHPEVQARLQGTIGKVYSALGLYRNAEFLLTRALVTNRQLTGSPPETFSALTSLAEVYWHQGRYSESERLYAELVKWCTATFATEDPRTLRAQFDLASAYQAQKRYDDAERAYRDVLAVQARVLGEDYEDAEQQLIIAYEGYLRTLGEKHEWTQSTSERLLELWKTSGKPAKIYVPNGIR